MSSRRSPPSLSTLSTSPLLPPTTITFLASWRGQLLICTIVLILGAVYFILQEPISTFRRRRREALSRVREEELIKMEKDKEKPAEKPEIEDKEKRGRERKKDIGKKRKVSLLRIPTVGGESSNSAGPNSIESSPVPIPRITLAAPPRPISSPSKSETPVLPATATVDGSSTPERSLSSFRPPPPSVGRPTTPPAVAPSDVPLPISPVAGSSRLHGGPVESDLTSNDGEASNSDSAFSTKPTSLDSQSQPGFSIIPEEGYLPLAVPPTSTKKKRRRGKAPKPLAKVDRRESEPFFSDGTPLRPTRTPLSSSPTTPSSRHARKASLTRPVNADLETLLTEREKMIDTLRANIGQAKAEESKAKQEAGRAKALEDEIRSDLDRTKRVGQRAAAEGRKKEAELNSKLKHLSSQHDYALQRLVALEQILRETGHPIPPPSVPAGGTPVQHLQPSSATLPPSSPYTLGFAPSPQPGVGQYMPYPSPGMYPSTMLHPLVHLNQPQPHPHRPPSASFRHPHGEEDLSLAGPLSLGPPHPHQMGSFVPPSPLPAGVGIGPGQYPFDLGVLPLSSPARQVSHNFAALSSDSPSGHPTPADLRRMSIESSVLKKKALVVPRAGSDSGESHRGSETLLTSVEEGEGMDGLGVGELNGLPAREFTGLMRDAESGPSSPSPPNQRSILLTPSNAELFHRSLSRDREGVGVLSQLDSVSRSGSGSSSRRGSTDLKAIGLKMINGEGGNIYFRSNGHDPAPNGTSAPPTTEDRGKRNQAYEPVYASIAHTPEQIAEIHRMREQAVKSNERERAS